MAIEPEFENPSGASDTGKTWQYVHASGVASLVAPGSISVSAYQAPTGGVSDASSQVQACITAVSAAGGGVVSFESGATYLLSSDIDLKTGVTLDLNGAHLVGTVQANGESGVLSASATGNFAANPIGSTSLSGNFAAFSPGDKIVIYQQPGTGSAGSGNEAGRHYATVSTASASSITFTPATALAFSSPLVMACEWAQMSGTVDEFDTVTVPSGAATGDLLRIETVSGSDSPYGAGSIYHEIVRLKNAATGTLEDQLAYTHVDPIVAVIPTVSNVGVRNGEVDTFVCLRAQDVSIHDIRTARLSMREVYGFTVDRVNARGDGTSPIVVNSTWCRRGIWSSVHVGGAAGTTDNGSFKQLSCIDVAYQGIVALDATTSSGSQGVYPIFFDFHYTPYSGWCHRLTMNGMVGDYAKGSSARRGIWLVGVRDSVATGLVTSDGLRLEDIANLVVSGVVAVGISVKDTQSPCRISDFSAAWLSIEGGRASSFGPGLLSGTGGSNSNRTIWVRAGTDVTDSDDLTLQGISSSATAGTETTIYLQSATGVHITGCRDDSGLAASVTLGSSIGAVNYGTNFFSNSVAQTGSTNGVSSIPGDLLFPSSAYNLGRVRLGDYYLWVDGSGRLRIKSGAPSSSTDGTIVGTQS